MSEITEKQAQPAKDPSAKIKVKLLKKHSHAGTAYEPGAEIEVTQAQADWLKAQGTI